MSEISYQSLVWLSYRLGATFAFGIPLVLFIWSSIKNEPSIIRLLSIYWKVASLMLISMLLLTGNRSIGYLISFLSPLLMVTCLWFWIDLNEELSELSNKKALPFVLKAWRWAVSCYGGFYASLSFTSLDCLNQIEGYQCGLWRAGSSGLSQIIKSLFNFLYGASWTETLSAFVGYLGLIIYVVGLIQWLIIRFPKQGRIAGDF